jgi:hypothetical protein
MQASLGLQRRVLKNRARAERAIYGLENCWWSAAAPGVVKFREMDRDIGGGE